jgi:hypothetical protein
MLLVRRRGFQPSIKETGQARCLTYQVVEVDQTKRGGINSRLYVYRILLLALIDYMYSFQLSVLPVLCFPFAKDEFERE